MPSDRILVLAALFVVAVGFFAPSAAQQSDLFEDEAGMVVSAADDDDDGEEEKKRELVAAPIPVVNPTYGTGLILGAMYLYNIDKESQPSFTAVGGAYTDSESYAFALGQAAYFNDDAWKIKAGAGVFDLNLRFYGIGRSAGDREISIPINQDGWTAGIRGMHRIRKNWYAGLQYWVVNVVTSIDTRSSGVKRPLELELDSQIAGVGVVIDHDSRDNRFNPTDGHLFSATWSDSQEAWGSDFEFSSTRIFYNHYHELKPAHVVAGRATLCMTPGDAPFYALCKFGSGVDLRGYVGGRYRDETMVTLQAEYRWRFYSRWGAVFFAGVGEVAASLGDYAFDDLLPGGGVGLRFKLSKTTNLNLSVDYAMGEGAADAWYFYAGEAF